MQLTIADKLVAQCVGYYLDGNIYENFDKDMIKAAGIPKKADMIKAVMADTKFMAAVGKYLTRYISDMDVINDALYDNDCTIVNKAVFDCDAAYDVVHEDRKIQQEAEDLKRSIRVLEAAGFKVTKA